MHIASLILPIFAIILTGWLAGVSGYLPRSVAGALMQFAYYVAMPALVFLTVAKEPLGSPLEWRFLAAFGGDGRRHFNDDALFNRDAAGLALLALVSFRPRANRATG